MQNLRIFASSHLRNLTERISGYSLLLLFVPLICCFSFFTFSVQAQDYFQCPPNGPSTFEGESETTLCQQYGNLICDVQIGNGTLITKSSQIPAGMLTGNVCIIGDFEINSFFIFQNATVKINPGVKIFLKDAPNVITTSGALHIDNSRIFACTGLWKGIQMGLSSLIQIYNNSKIEDAEEAISADKQCDIYVQNTIFNRNIIGLKLSRPLVGKSIGPIVHVLKGNLFTCKAPINGTTNGLSELGIKLQNVSLLPFLEITDNIFQTLKNGIYAEGDNSVVYIDNFVFDTMKEIGVYFKGRHLNVANSRFVSNRYYGIHFVESSILTLDNNDFIDGQPEEVITRTMVFLSFPKEDNNIEIKNNYFYTDGYLKGSVVGLYYIVEPFDYTTCNVDINHNHFDFFNRSNVNFTNGQSSRAMTIDGNFTSQSNLKIEHNYFNLNPFVTTNNRGVEVRFGIKYNVFVNHNYFTGGSNYLHFGESPGDEINKMYENTFDESQGYGRGTYIDDFSNLEICSNVDSGASLVSYLFNNNCLGTNFSDNTIYGSPQDAVWIYDAVIGQQIRTGNRWFPKIQKGITGITQLTRPSVRLQNNDPLFSKFFIHTPQSIWNGQSYTYFSEHHPSTDKIIPDFNNEFFEYQSGTTIGCIDRFNGPIDYVDVSIANGTFEQLNPSSISFDSKRFLYNKLKLNTTYANSHQMLASFLTNNENSNIGRFYRLDKKIDASCILPVYEYYVLKKTNKKIDSIQAITTSSIELTEFSSDIAILDSIRLSFLSTIKQSKIANLIVAKNICDSIIPTNALETIRKSILEIYLNTQIFQDGQATIAQHDQLLDYALLSSKTAGKSIYLASGFLPICSKPQNRPAYDTLIGIEGYSNYTVDRNSLDFNSVINNFNVFPNPTNGLLNVVSNKDYVSLKLFSTLGDKVFEQKFENVRNNILNFEIPNGVYSLFITYNDGSSESTKIVIKN